MRRIFFWKNNTNINDSAEKLEFVWFFIDIPFNVTINKLT